MAFREKFQALTKQSIDEQMMFFVKRFVFRLNGGAVDTSAGGIPPKYLEVKQLCTDFKTFLKNDDGKADSMSPAVAADFFQKKGQVRTAMQRKAELADVDVNGDGRTSFIEYLVLHFKIMILEEFFQRKGESPDVDMANNGVGLTGVGERLIEELFAPPVGVDPELEKLMKSFATSQQAKAAKMAELEAVVASGGVKGMGANTELQKMKSEDDSSLHAIEARIANAIKKADKSAAEEVAKIEKNIAAADAAEKASHRKG
jgi:hypothetical protein